MKTPEQLGEWLANIIKGMVEFPDEAEVKHEIDEMGVKYSVSVARTDRGKIIGREGKNADALRVVLRSAGFQANMRASMLIVIPGEREFLPNETAPRRTSFAPDLHDQRSKPRNDYQEN